MLIIALVERGNVDKAEFLEKFRVVADIFIRYAKLFRGIVRVEKYKDRSIYNDTLGSLATNLEAIGIYKPVIPIFIDICRKRDFTVLDKTYKILLNKWNLLDISLVTAYDIVLDQKNKLANEVRMSIKGAVSFRHRCNPGLIGGEYLVVNSSKIDNSVLSKLDKLHKYITE